MSKWEIVKLSDIGKVVTGNTPPTKNLEYYNSNDIAFYKPNDLSKTELSYLDGATVNVSELARPKIRLLPKGSVLVTCIGIIGKVGIALDECTCNQQINAIIPNTKIVDNRYLAYCIISKKTYIQGIANAPIVPIINKTQFSNIQIPLPPLETQTQIAEILDTVAELLAMRKQRLAELDNLIKSTFYDMFGDPVTNEKVWKNSTLGPCCSLIKDGPHVSPNYVEDGIPFVSVNNIIKGYWDLEKVRYITKEDYEKFSKKCKPEYRDVLYTKGGTTGYAKYIDRDFEFMNWVHIAVLKYKRELLNGIFLENMLNSNYCYNQSQLYTRGIANRDLVLGQMSKISLFLPPLNLQTQFAEIVTKIEEQKVLVKKAIAETQYLFDSLMSEYFE